MESIVEQIGAVIRDVLDNDELVIDESSSAQNVEDWDSLNHIQIVVAIEKHFRIKFTAAEIQKWKNVGDISESVQAKIASKG